MNKDLIILLKKERLQEEKSKLPLLEEQLLASKVIVRQLFEESFPRGEEDYEGIIREVEMAPTSEIVEGYDMLISSSSTSTPFLLSDEISILQNHISYVEKVLKCKENIAVLKEDIIKLETWWI